MSEQNDPEQPPPRLSEAKKKALAEADAGCDHESEDGSPCSQCRPPESWVAKGLFPPEWGHVPWDNVEMKRHKLIKTKDDDPDIDERHGFVDRSLRRSLRVGEDDSSAEMEAWPHVKVTGRRTDEDVPEPTAPPERAPPSAVMPPARSLPKRRSKSASRSSKRSVSKRVERRVRKSVSVNGRRVNVQVDVNVQVRVVGRNESRRSKSSRSKASRSKMSKS